MKSFKTLALVVGLMGLSGVSQAQFSSTWTLVSDYDFRGTTQTAKDPALQASADYAFGDTGWAIGAWASNVDFGDDDADIELDLYAGYTGEINETFSWTAGVTYYTYPSSDLDETLELYAGFNAGDFGFKQWYSDDWGGTGDSAQYTEVNYTIGINDAVSVGLHAGYSWGDYWDDFETFDYGVQLNYTYNNFTFFGKFTGTDGDAEVKTDVGNNEARFLVGVTTTLPWGK